jgi:hypothetical protein
VPTVTDVSPTQGPETGGNTVTITGTGLGEGASVFFGGTPAWRVIPESDTEIIAISPAEQPGQPSTVDITVSCSGSVSPVVAADQFSYLQAPPSSSPATTPSSATPSTSP